jgi:hypothetical protein
VKAQVVQAARDWIPIAVSIAGAIPSCAAAFSAYLSYKTGQENREAISRTNAAVATVDEKVEAVKTATDGMKTELVKSTALASHAAGLAEGHAAEIAASDAKAVAHEEGRAEGAATLSAPIG